MTPRTAGELRSKVEVTAPTDPAVALTILVPAYNEVDGLARLVPVLRERFPAAELLVVDDGSTDGSGAMAARAGARVLTHERNRGYGAALKTGIRAARGEFVVTLDADGQHDVADLENLLREAPRRHLVSGARDSAIHKPFWRVPGRWAIWRFANLMSRVRVPDANCGFRVYRRETLLRYVHLCPEGFSFSTTSLLVFLERGYDVAFVPIRARERTGSSRSTVTPKTGFATLLLILRLTTLLDPLRIFLPVVITLGLLGVVWAIPYALAGRGMSVGALLLLNTSVILFFFGLLADQIAELRKERYQ